jgi:hypothetical protein
MSKSFYDYIFELKKKEKENKKLGEVEDEKV